MKNKENKKKKEKLSSQLQMPDKKASFEEMKEAFKQEKGSK